MSFTWPYFLLALLVVPVALAAVLWLDRRRAKYAVAFTNLDLLASVAEGHRRAWRRWIPVALFLLALAVASAALARPRATVSVPAQQATIVLLVDVSGSMRAADVQPSRLGAAQAAMQGFLDKVPSKVKVGLVTFSTNPDVLVLPTTDREIMRQGVDLLVPEAGTAIGDGLGIAVRVAKASLGNAPRGADGKAHGAIILLSDGAQTRGVLTPLQGAALARQAGLRVFTIALGTNHGTLGPGVYGFGPGGFGFGNGTGGRFSVRPDPAILRAISTATGGTAFQAKSASKVQSVYNRLGSSVVHRASKREVSSWFAGAAALLLLGSLGAARITGERLP